MDITVFIGLLGGLALFLYGMQMMSDGLEGAAGNRMKSILEKLTSNRFLGVIVGAGITMVIQSSSATTVMVVGFVNSGMMTLNQAVWIIMGANIGTTITAQLVSLDIGMVAPLIAFVGVAILVFFKMPKLHHYAKIMAGFGVLFIGMEMMGDAMVPLRDSEMFVSFMTNFSNPVLGIVVGMVFTAIIQSSSAAVGILQTLGNSGLIGFKSSVFVLFGTNIGTCVTALLASAGANRNAKRTTLIHLMFNIIGTVIFTILCVTFPITDFVASITPGKLDSQIANMHTLFNIVTTILLIPFGNYLAKLATLILPDSKRNAAKRQDIAKQSPLLSFVEASDKGRIHLGYSAIHTDVLSQEIERMLKLACENVERCYSAVIEGNTSYMDKIEETEDTIDDMNNIISQYISKILVHNNSGKNVADIEQYFLITGNAERIGDHALNIAGYVSSIKDRGIVFSDGAKAELEEMRDITKKAIEKVMVRDDDMTEWLSKIAAMEQKIDDMTVSYRDSHLNRMREGKCSEEACVLYSELLTDFERIGDHVLNIAQAYSKMYVM
ncbi:MAG: Na/Pi cotransporter family protein [Lachnospiraceae bacterium]|nr:Na/Pi cotransporter family protein [Lachnospiraceae bacterium]